MEPDQLRKVLSRSIRRHIWMSQFALFGLLGAVVLWASVTTITGAVISPGQVVLEGHNKIVQHPDGGVISRIHVEDGDHVAKGQMLLQLDARMIRANLEFAQGKYYELVIEQARINTELSGKTEIVLSPGLAGYSSDPNFVDILNQHQAVLTARHASRIRVIDRLQSQIAQLYSSLSGLCLQASARQDEEVIIAARLQDMEILYEKKLTSSTNRSLAQREHVRIQGLLGATRSEIARIQHQLRERQLELASIWPDAEAEMIERLRGMRVEIEAARLDILHNQDLLSRIDIRAPKSGIVHDISVNTIGGVVSPAAPIMEILPVEDNLVLELRVRPLDIDKTYPSQPVSIQFPGLNMRTAPRLRAKLVFISGDLVTDPATGERYYLARAHLMPSELERIEGVSLQPGMPALAFIETQQRRVLTYLVDPLMKQIELALKEE